MGTHVKIRMLYPQYSSHFHKNWKNSLNDAWCKANTKHIQYCTGSAPENHIFLSFAKEINLLTTLFKIRSNSLFTNKIQCSNCKKNLAPEKATLHLLFACPNCKTRDLLNSSLYLLWDAKTFTSWKKQKNCLNYYF